MEYYIVTLILAAIKIALLLLFLCLKCRKKNKVQQVVQNVNSCYNSQHPQVQLSVINMSEGYSAPAVPPPPPYWSYKEESVPLPIVISMEDKDHLPSYTQAIAETHNISNHLPPKS